MAEDIIFKVGVDSDGSGAKSLKTLKAEFKQLNEELSKTTQGTKEYRDTLAKLGDVKDEMKDLNTAINTLNPEGKIQAFTGVAGSLASGFQAATGAAALFGAESEELEKTLLRVQAASALAQGINGIIGITDAFKVLGVVLAANPIMAIGAVIASVSAAIVLLTKDTNDYEGAQKSLNKTLEDSVNRQEDYNKKIRDAQIEYDVLSGKITEYQANILKLEGDQADERKKIAEKYTQDILDLAAKLGVDLQDIEFDTNGKILGASLEGANDQFNARLQFNEGLIKIQEAAEKDGVKLKEFYAKVREKVTFDSEISDAELAAKINREFYEQQIKDKQAYEDVLFEIEAMTWNDIVYPLKVKKAEQEIDLFKKVANEKRAVEEQTNNLRDAADAEFEKRRLARIQAELDIQKNYFDAVGGLSDTFFNFQLKAAKGNAAEEEKIRKKQFQVNKSFAAARATIDGINAVQGVLAQSSLYGPVTIPLAISMGVATAANVAKILSQQFGTGASNASTDINFNQTGIQTSAPQTIATPITRLNEQGQNLSGGMRAYVVETDITESQQRINRLAEQSTF